MSNSPNNPMDASGLGASPLSKTVYCIAGIRTTVYGIDQLPENVSEIACLWLLHPRLATDESMAPMAGKAISHWNNRRGSQKKGLIAVSFDQRNHGTRKIDPVANEAWRQGNPRHAQDMFSIYQGTAQDTSLLLSHLSSYLPQTLPAPTQHLVIGVSLGAHSAWHCILHDPRIRAAGIIIGCPDFARLMAHRASKSKLSDWNPKTKTTSSSSGGGAAGTQFFGSASFPDALIDSIDNTDPAGVFLPPGAKATGLAFPLAALPNEAALEPLGRSRQQGVVRLNRSLKGKAVLNLSGGADKLVPHACAEPFFAYLKRAREGWWKDGKEFWFEDRVFDGVGHAVSPDMAEAAVRFVGDIVAGDIKVESAGMSRSKM